MSPEKMMVDFCYVDGVYKQIRYSSKELGLTGKEAEVKCVKIETTVQPKVFFGDIYSLGFKALDTLPGERRICYNTNQRNC